jgi:hypothetical protein
MQSLVTSCLRAQIFFVLSGQQLLCMQEFFFSLSGHLFSAGRAQFFFGRFCSARAPCMRVRGANFSFLSSRFQQLRAQFFSQPHTTAVCAAFCSCVQSLCHPRSKETIFLSLPCSSVRDTGRAELFFCAVLFLLPSGLISADTWFCFFFDAWNLRSTLFQNPASEI